MPIEFQRESSPAARGKCGEMLSNSRRSWGWPGLRQRGAVAACRRRSRAGGGALRGIDGVPVARVLEGGGGVARKLLRDDVVLLVLLVGVEGLCSVGSTARPSGGGA
jgi:hypothetical protein